MPLKCLFVHDTPFRFFQGAYYSTNLTSQLWSSRYLLCFDELVVCGREIEGDEATPQKFSRSSCEHVIISTCKTYHGPEDMILKVNSIHAQIKSLVQSVDCAILRLPSWLGIAAERECRRQNKPYLVELVACAWGSYWDFGTKGKLAAPYFASITKRAVKRAPYVCYVSRQFLQRRYPTQGVQLGCPDVCLAFPQVEVLQTRLDKIQSAPDQKVILGLIGALNVPYRGHHTMLRCLGELISRGIDAHIRFLGGGNPDLLKETVRQLGLSDRVEFCGQVPSGDPVLHWIDEIDILTMPTKQETLGRAIIEAMSRGCPVIGSIETAIGEQLGSDCLCKADDYHAMADIIEKMITDRAYMTYCAQENFYRSFKYASQQTDPYRQRFYQAFADEVTNHGTAN